MNKKILIIFLIFFLLVSCSFWEKTAEEKLQDTLENDISTIKDDLYNTPILSKDFWKKASNLENNLWNAFEKNMYEYQINKLLEEWDDLTIPRDIMYSISVFDDTKDTFNIEKQLIEKWYRIWEKEDVFWMTMFYIYKKHPVDVNIISVDEKELNSIINVDWLSYDWWDTKIVKK